MSTHTFLVKKDGKKLWKMHCAWSMEQDMKAVLAQAESCRVYVKPPKIMQNMHGIIPFMFDCWANPIVSSPCVKDDSHKLHFLHAAVAESCVSAER